MRLLTAGSLVRVQLGEPNFAPLAQLVEQLTLNQWVLGSSPRWCTKNTMPMKHGILIYNSEKTKSLSDSYEI